MKYSAGQAAKATGKSVPTITRAIRKGLIPAVKTETGGFQIEPAELHRVFPAIKAVSNVTAAPLGRETPRAPTALQGGVKLHRLFTPAKSVSESAAPALGRETQSVTQALQEKARLVLQEKVKTLEDALSEARAERDAWREQAERLAAALPLPVTTPETAKKTWWSLR